MSRPGQRPLPGLDGWGKPLRDAWADWLEHRRQMGRPMTQVAQDRLRRKLDGMGQAAAVAAIDWSLENGWVGVYEPPSAADEAPNGFRLDDYLKGRREA